MEVNTMEKIKRKYGLEAEPTDTPQSTGKEEPKKSNKPVEVFIDPKTFSKGQKLYECDVLTGEVRKTKLLKQKYRNNITGQITNKIAVLSSPNLFYLTAKDIREARAKFEKQFKEMDEKLIADGDYTPLKIIN